MASGKKLAKCCPRLKARKKQPDLQRNDESDIRFVGRVEGASAHDDMGATATEAVGHTVAQFENEELTALWRSVMEQEAHHE